MSETETTQPATQQAQPPATQETKMPGTMSLSDPSLTQKPAETFTVDSIVNKDGTFKEGWASSFEGGESLSNKYNNINDLIKGFVNANKLIGKSRNRLHAPEPMLLTSRRRHGVSIWVFLKKRKTTKSLTNTKRRWTQSRLKSLPSLPMSITSLPTRCRSCFVFRNGMRPS